MIRGTVSLILFTAGFAMAQTANDPILVLAKKLTDIGDSLKQPERIASEPDKHMDTLRALRGLRATVDDAMKTHGEQMKTSRGQGPYHKLDIAARYADRELKEYERYAAMFASKQGIDEALARVRQSAKIGIDNNSPAFFKPDGDVARGIESARLRLKALEALDPKSKDIDTSKAEIEKTEKEFAGMQEKLKEQILASNELPPDDFRQPDRDAVLKMLNDFWAKNGSKDTVLKVGIVNPAWNRGVSWQKVGIEWQKTDRSKLQGYVIVAKNDKLAVRHSINFVKDHLANDTISIAFVFDLKGEPPLASLILRSKVK